MQILPQTAITNKVKKLFDYNSFNCQNGKGQWFAK